MPRIGKCIETERRSEVIGARRREWGVTVQWGEFQRGDEEVLEMEAGGGGVAAQQRECAQYHWTVHFKVAKPVITHTHTQRTI